MKRSSTIRDAVLKQAICTVLLLSPAFAGGKKAEAPAPGPPPLLLDGGRRLEYVRAFSSESEVKLKRSFFSKVVDFVAGAPEFHRMVRPYSVAIDSTGRIVVSDPGAPLVHIFDFAKQKYQKLEGGKQEFKSPIGLAIDGKDNIYVSDSELGKVFVFDAKGKFRRYIGDLKGEGYFKRPTGLAVDSAHNRIYITDTVRDAVYIADLDGNILGSFGKRGQGDGEFNYPTDILVRDDEVVVVDAMNFRVQVFDREGHFRGKFGRMGVETGSMFRSKGMAADRDGDLYIADAFMDMVQVFNPAGELLYYFGRQGNGAAEFQLPAGVCIDRQDRIYVVDSYNRRVQVFQFVGPQGGVGGME